MPSKFNKVTSHALQPCRSIAPFGRKAAARTIPFQNLPPNSIEQPLPLLRKRRPVKVQVFPAIVEPPFRFLASIKPRYQGYTPVLVKRQ